ncbi:MAG: DUF1573 domain-containing protein [Bacteroidales bacterium]|nr:DUF1573 domain-containing protein [Bacteroidales bacterium]MCF6341498.1 DUF1573 domain-containing protein [Bacteroidales bacterium]
MKRVLIVLTMMLMVSVVSAQDASKKEGMDQKMNGPAISFKTTTHDYGEIYQGSDGSFSFVFTNTGNEPLILSKPRSSCGCTVPSWPKEPILPGDDSQIKVTYNTKKVGPFNKTVTVYSNAKNKKSIVLRIKGKVVAKPAEALPEKETGTGAAPINK